MVSKKTTSTAKADKAVETKTVKPVVEKTEVKSEQRNLKQRQQCW